MRKAWITLAVIGILLCLFVSLGAAGYAAEAQDDALTILAVNGGHLDEDTIALLKGERENMFVIDVAGDTSDVDHAGYDYVFMGAVPEQADEASTMAMTDAASPVAAEPPFKTIYTGEIVTLKAPKAGGGEQVVNLVGVDGTMTAEFLFNLTAGLDGEVIAVGAPEAAQAVSGAGLKTFLTAGVAEDCS